MYHELKRRMMQAKVDYKRKLESKLQQTNAREVWRGMRNITGYSKKNDQVIVEEVDKANDFKLFYNRFDEMASVHPASVAISSPTTSAAALTPLSYACNTPPTIAAATTHSSVFHGQRGEDGAQKNCLAKAEGPDGVCPILLKVCSA